jgi:PAS domain S-box-containing protein
MLCSAALWRALIDNSTAVIFIKSIDGRYLFINRHAEKVFNVTNEQLKGKTAHAFSQENLQMSSMGEICRFSTHIPHPFPPF